VVLPKLYVQDLAIDTSTGVPRVAGWGGAPQPGLDRSAQGPGAGGIRRLDAASAGCPPWVLRGGQLI